ncbi:MAG: zinc-ribbon domain-containing protein [Alphaproteobacteria bacterium]|nr:zinc-ribbon domain-containing protein [Alphaproteobacteria bacterium]
MFITCPKCSARYEIPAEVHLSAGKKMKCSNCQHVFALEAEQPAEPLVEVREEQEIINIDPVPVQEENVFATEETAEPEETQMPPAFEPVESDQDAFEPVAKHSVARVVLVLLLFAFVGLLVVAGVLYRDILLAGLDFPFNKADTTTAAPMPEIMPPTTAPVAPSVVTQPVVEEKTIVTEITPDGEKLVEEKIPEQEETIAEPEMLPIEEPVAQTEPAAGRYEASFTARVLPSIQSVRFEIRMLSEPTISIEGVLKNETPDAMFLPEKVRAVAYDAQGKVLFEKDIYLTDRILAAGESKPFFGSYAPAPDRVQWVDVTF